MSTSQNTASTPKSVFFAICLVAVSLWGLYLWKFKAEADAPQGSLALTADVGSVVVSDRAVMPLSATRETDVPAAAIQPTESPEPLRPSGAPAVAANQGIALGDVAATPLTAPREESNKRTESTSSLPARPATSTDADVLAGRRAMERGQFVEARRHLNKALEGRLSMEQQEGVRRDLATIADKLIFGKLASPGDPIARMHEVASGESLYVLAKRHKVTIDFLAGINRLAQKDMIRAGARLKVVDGPFRAVVRKSQHRMDIFLQDQYVKSYTVGLGMDDGTPIGEWEVTTKQVNPAWTDPRDGTHYSPDDPNNPIGDRWIGLDCVAGECIGRSGFGIHGTIDPGSIGADLSMGCVRLLADDVAQLYDLLVPGDSIIEIVP
ncbi:MAG: L,D-transpeptidase family protein [Phycisphaerales bacterium]|nr:L,D-transpeptidase family protein [Phycisphaerales bacterium]MCB9863908.1 L,D-transpeptidase family protein [Phycisphaerales bacterium]